MDLDFELSFQYNESEYMALNEVKGKIEKGKCIVLCGESGCGKSTLLRCFNQLIPQFYDGNLKGFCHLKEKDAKELSIGQTGKIAASVFQDPRSQFFTLNSSTEVAFGLENFGFSNAEIVKRVDAIFEDFKLEKLKDRNVFELSSGERQLIAILAARAVDTDIYLLDEPTANLDYTAIEKLSDLLMQLKEQGRTMVISEHRLYYLMPAADEFWFMKQGEIKRKFTKDEIASLTQKELEELGLRTTSLSRIENEFVSEEKHERNEEHILDLKKIQFQYKKMEPFILKGVSLHAETNEVIGLVGRNGCGKTTFGKIVTGLYKSSSGSILFDEQKMSGRDLVRKGIFIMQEAEFQFFTNSVENELYYGFKTKEEKEERKEEVERLLKKVNLWHCKDQHPFSLSGGQMQKLVLLLACLSRKPIVVLDEPTAGLDYKSLCQCVDLIKEMQQRKIVFVISHDMELLSKVCTRAVFIEDGKDGEQFDLTKRQQFLKLKEEMKEHLSGFSLTDRQKEKLKGKEKKIDPRPKLFLFLLALIAGIGTDSPLILCTFTAVMAVFLYEKQWKSLISGIFLMSVFYIGYLAYPSVATAFIVSFFPRVVIVCYAALLLVKEEDASRTLFALRKLHIPEKMIMVFSVIFRFFPVLKKDLGMMSQSLKTRGFFQKFSDKVKEVPEYVEIMVVPMVFRVIRIAEALSASAETRGISLEGKRDSYINLKLKAVDLGFFCLMAGLVIVGVLI